jgi:cytoskeleton protein RodZ
VGEFGDKFRKTREIKELSLDDVSSVTKINRRMLQAIEEEQFDQLPGGVFNRGFIRAYAKHLGLNPEDAVNDYLACLSRAQIESHEGWDAERLRDPHEPAAFEPGTARAFKPVAKGEQAPVQVVELPELQLPRMDHVRPPRKEYLRRPSAAIPWFWVAAVICVVMAALLFSTRQKRSTPAALTTSVTAPASQPLPPGPVPAPSQPVGAPSSSVKSSTTAASNPPPANPAPSPAIQAEAEQDPNALEVEKNSDLTIGPLGNAAAKTAEKPAVKLTLVVRASENTWIWVTSDGQLVTKEMLIAPAATTFHAARELVVRVGNPAAVSFLWNGQELPAQGVEGGAKTFTFDAQGMHAAESPQPPAQN